MDLFNVFEREPCLIKRVLIDFREVFIGVNKKGHSMSQLFQFNVMTLQVCSTAPLERFLNSAPLPQLHKFLIIVTYGERVVLPTAAELLKTFSAINLTLSSTPWNPDPFSPKIMEYVFKYAPKCTDHSCRFTIDATGAAIRYDPTSSDAKVYDLY